MTRVTDWHFRGLRMFIAACLALTVVLVFGNVGLRYSFDSGITISEQLSRWLLVWLTFVGAIVALRGHAHLGVDSLCTIIGVGGTPGMLTMRIKYYAKKEDPSWWKPFPTTLA